MTDWKPIDNSPPEMALLLIDTVDDVGNPGGTYLGGVANGKWYWMKGAEEIRLRNCSVTWWALVTDPPGN